MGKKNRKSRNVQSSSEASARGSTEERTRDSKSIDARPKEKLLDKEDSVEAKSAKPETRKPLTEQQKQKLLEIEKVMRARAQKAKELKAKSNATTSESAKPPSGNPSKKTSSSEVPSQEAIKDLVSTIAKAASNRKQTASSSKSESDLKEDLASLLQQIRLDDITKQSPLASDKPLTNEEGLKELVNLLKKSSNAETRKKDLRSLSVDSHTQSLLDQTSSAVQNARQESSESDGSKEDVGPCQLCSKDASTRCTGCRKVFYCSRSCQKSHWNTHKDVCRPYKVGKIEGFGRVLVATRNISVEEEILKEKPFVVGPRPSSDHVCLSCYKRVSGDYRCSACNWPLCGPSCADTPQHKPECQASVLSGTAGPEALTTRGFTHHNEIITTIRCLVQMQNDQQRWRTLVERFGARHNLVQSDSMQFLHHLQDIVEPLRTAMRINLLPGLANLENSAIHTALNILQVNSLPCPSTYGEVYGLYPMASLLGHSCVPNTRTRMQDNHLVVKATENIVAGSALTVMLTDIFWGTKARREHILQERYFSCSCRRCSDATELGSYFSALVCQKCSSSQPVLPTKPLLPSVTWACVSCKHQVSSDDVSEINLTLGSEAAHCLQNPNVEGLESLLEKWLPKVHTNHYHLHAVKHSLLQLYGGSVSKDENDQKYWREMAKKEKICQEFLKVCSLLDPSITHSVPQFGLAFYELHKSVLEFAKRNFGLAKINKPELKKKLMLAKALLRRSMDILKNEAEGTPEEQLYSKCQDDFIAIGKWILATGLM